MMIDLYNGDCLEVMKSIPDGSVDLILTDPPYLMKLKPQRKNAKFHGVQIQNDNNAEWVDGFFSEVARVLKNNSVAFIFCNHFCIADFILSAKKVNLDLKNHLIWDKCHFGIGNNWRPIHESILVFTNGKFKTVSKNNKTILSYKKVYHSKSVHPTQKPIDLLEHLISESDLSGDVVCDPFMGSGSTMIACLNTNRKGIGIELDKHYFDIAQKRINEHQAALDAVFF